MYVGKKKERFVDRIRWKSVVDALSVIIGTATVVSAVYIFIFVGQRLKWLPLMFLGAASVNLIEGCKKIYYGKYVSGIFFILLALIITVFSLLSYIVIWKSV